MLRVHSEGRGETIHSSSYGLPTIYFTFEGILTILFHSFYELEIGDKQINKQIKTYGQELVLRRHITVTSKTLKNNRFLALTRIIYLGHQSLDKSLRLNQRNFATEDWKSGRNSNDLANRPTARLIQQSCGVQHEQTATLSI